MKFGTVLMATAALLALSISASSAQRPAPEQAQPAPERAVQVAVERPRISPVCACERGVVRNPGFTPTTVAPGGNIPPSVVANWNAIAEQPGVPASGTPQVGNAVGHGPGVGYINFWGNGAIGEGVYQSGLNLPPGIYRLTLWAHRTAGPHPVQIKAVIRNGPGTRADPAAATTGDIANGAWTQHTMVFTVTSQSNTLILFPVNANTARDGATVSTAQVDDICLDMIGELPRR